MFLLYTTLQCIKQILTSTDRCDCSWAIGYLCTSALHPAHYQKHITYHTTCAEGETKAVMHQYLHPLSYLSADSSVSSGPNHSQLVWLPADTACIRITSTYRKLTQSNSIFPRDVRPYLVKSTMIIIMHALQMKLHGVSYTSPLSRGQILPKMKS